MCSITMCDRMTDSICLQTSVGREFRTTYDLNFIDFFYFIQNYVQVI